MRGRRREGSSIVLSSARAWLQKPALPIYDEFLLSVGAVSAQDEADTWRTYRNERFGLSLLLPSRVFALEKQSDAGDGSVFVSKDGEARLLIGALENAEAQTPRTYQEYIAHKSYADYNITYRRRGVS